MLARFAFGSGTVSRATLVPDEVPEVVTPLTGGSPLPVSGRQVTGSELKVRGLSGASPDVERLAAHRRHL
jgi:hypothetical protein